MNEAATLLLGACFAVDLVVGDPEWFVHPVRVIGGLINFLERRLRGEGSLCIERIKGAALTIAVVGISAGLAHLFLRTSEKLSPLLGKLIWVYLGYTTIAVKDLRVKAADVYKALKMNVVSARGQVSKIVGRDTRNLNEDGIIRATVESVAENTNDGIVAPLFYLALGGPVLAIGYKAVNTLDSMVGYKNKKHLHFGWFSAKLDDIVNFIPARICGVLISVSSFLILKGFTGAFKTMLRDGRKHTSPNSGVSEAAMAGALGIRLGRERLGRDREATNKGHIVNALNISLITSILMIILCMVFRWLI